MSLEYTFSKKHWRLFFYRGFTYDEFLELIDIWKKERKWNVPENFKIFAPEDLEDDFLEFA